MKDKNLIITDMDKAMRIRGIHPNDAPTQEDQNIADIILRWPEDRIRMGDCAMLCWSITEDVLLIEALLVAYSRRGEGFGRSIVTDFIDSVAFTTGHTPNPVTKFAVNPYTEQAELFFQNIGFVKCEPEICERLSPKLDSFNTYFYERK